MRDLLHLTCEEWAIVIETINRNRERVAALTRRW